MANVFIDIAAEFTGAKSFKKAESATESLTRNVKKLAKTIGVAYSGAQVLAFAKSSVKAAAADQKAQQQLALALKNVGLERDAASAEGYIQRLQSEFGIVDDLLRPAYQSLAIATRDTAEAQRLLNLSLDISAATGKDLGSVTAALSKAYLGNNTALTRLGVGISKADLKTKSFYEITTNLADTFKGSATTAAATFKGSMDKLAVASANVQEIIGTGIIDALTKLGNDDSVSNLAKNMEAAALYTADVIRGIGVLTEKLKSLPGVSNFKVGMIPILGAYLEGLSGLGKQSRTTPKPFSTPMTVSSQTSNKAAAAQAAKLAAAQVKATKSQIKAQQDAFKLSKAKSIFDLEKIQIEAALKGKLTEEEQIRLKLMKAIAEENAGAIDKLLEQLKTAQIKTAEMQKLLDTIKTLEIQDPFGTWKIDPLTASINELTKSIGGVGTQIQASGREWSSFANTVATTVIRPNLSEWSSSFSSAAAAASAAVGSANAALASSTAASSSAASAANKATADAIAAANKSTADAIAAAEKAQSEILAKLKADSAATTAAIKADQEKAVADAQAAADALDKQIEATLAAIRAKAAQDAEAAAAAAATATGTGGSNINITVNTGIGDANAIAEEIQKILDDAHNRGSLVGGLYAD